MDDQSFTLPARVTRAGERRVLTLGGLRLAYLEGTDGEGNTLELLLPPRFHEWAPTAFHLTHLTYFVVLGEVTFTCGERVTLAGPETSVAVPPGLAHSLENSSGAEAHVLLLARPGGLHRYFEALAGLRSRSRGWPPEPPGLLEALERAYGVTHETA
ncbi:cupin domain-containing protein [Deinococcus apachensis]|uniref:cupin domain-containing protein n=1 Tax=Deinococcus apachensis TaxID=309886 RepID=UPI00036D42A3|nr:cupin domain-containing protein [Deinococcus apachensis]